VTVTVDTDGNIIDLPHMRTQNHFLRNNPELLEQIRDLVQNLRSPNTTNVRLSPELEDLQQKTESLFDELGDMHTIINYGLNKDLNTVETIISINANEDNVCVERIDIPEDIRQPVQRDISFIEILYKGMYHILTNLIAMKYHFFEITKSQKAYDDCNKCMKYRKCVIVSYLVLKNRLDKWSHLKHSNPDVHQQLANLHDQYYKEITPAHMPHVHQYDSCMLIKFSMGAQLNTVELQSINQFYENFAQLVDLFEHNKIPKWKLKDLQIIVTLIWTPFQLNTNCFPIMILKSLIVCFVLI
jgi:hypothetical protein